MKFSRVRDVERPQRGHEGDAGIDFFVPNDFVPVELEPGDRINIASGIRVDVPFGFALIAFNKSGVATKTGLLAGACVIDSGYQGECHINLVNASNDDVEIEPGMKIIQFVLLPVNLGRPIEMDDDDLFRRVSTRGQDGFGSTG